MKINKQAREKETKKERRMPRRKIKASEKIEAVR